MYEFLLTNTRVWRETSQVMARLKALREESSSLTHAIDSIFDAIEAITEVGPRGLDAGRRSSVAMRHRLPCRTWFSGFSRLACHCLGVHVSGDGRRG